MKKKEFIAGVASLSASMLIIQSLSMGFSVYVSSKFGAAQMGLFHLVMSVYSFGMTVAMSGMPLAATRLVSESISPRNSNQIIKKSLVLGALFGLLSGAGVFVFSGKVSASLIKEPRCEAALKILSFALPCISISGVIRGYFTGIQKVSCITISHMAEEFSYIFTMLFLMKALGTEQTGVLICSLSLTLSAVTAFLCDTVMYTLSKRKSNICVNNSGRFKSILSIAMPVAAGSYLRSGLVAVENLIIPHALTKSGIGNPLAGYGTVKAMAMPVLMFPYVFLQSFTSLLVPEISSRSVKENKKSVFRAAKKSIKYTFLFGTAVAVFLLFFGRKIGLTFYNSPQAGAYITALSLLALPMYVDTVTDSILKGLNQQVYSLKINIIDSALRIPVMYILLPYAGVYGYIAVLYGSELLNLALSIKRLKKIL